MKPPEMSENESERLQVLHALEILDTDNEERFDRYTRIVKRILDVPIALVSLVDTDRQWFKSRAGLDATETSREISFCGHTILNDRPMIISDTFEDDRFADNPLVTSDPKIRFYAGAPIYAPSGQCLGTLCAIDRVPRQLSVADIQALTDLAMMVNREIAFEQMATIDELTQISNRRGFEMVARKVLDVSTRQKLRSLLLFIDLNDFKPINDSYGHSEGDRALRIFADGLVATCRHADAIARIGGDEFAVLLSNTTPEHAPTIIHRLESYIQQRIAQESISYSLAFSYGIAEFDPEHPENLDSLVAEADLCMYQHKEASRPEISAV